MSAPVKASCYCGDVQVQVDPAALLGSGFCSCQSCRKAHATLLYSVAYFQPNGFSIVRGGDQLRCFFSKDLNPDAASELDKIGRFFCSRCGSRMFNRIKVGEMVMVGVFHGTFDDPAHCTAAGLDPTAPGSRNFHMDEQPHPRIAQFVKDLEKPAL